MNQNTLKSSIQFEGTGLHTGITTQVTVHPAPANSGLRFVRTDIEGRPEVPAEADFVDNTERSTTLKRGLAEVRTVEHLLSALYANQIDNAMIEVSGPELPILDGSAKSYSRAISEVGIEAQDAPAQVLCIDSPVRFESDNGYTTFDALPSDRFEVSSLVDFNSKYISSQYAGFTEEDNYGDEIASARTFVFWHELEPLFSKGLIKGGSLDNALTIVNQPIDPQEVSKVASMLDISEDHYKGAGIYASSGLQFPNEPARHKLLDLLGDLALTGVRIKGKIVASKPGHRANVAFAKHLRNLWKEQKKLAGIPKYDPNQPPVYVATDLEKILPHRYPFLLVDKIIEVSESHVVGIKNVTFNEQFFQGHFPGNPVMPGVLQIEALAQTGGILALNTVDDPENWDTYFVKIEKARFKTKVVPGDTLILKMELLSPIRRGICHMYGTAYVGNKVATEGEFMAQIVRQNRS